MQILSNKNFKNKNISIRFFFQKGKLTQNISSHRLNIEVCAKSPEMRILQKKIEIEKKSIFSISESV